MQWKQKKLKNWHFPMAPICAALPTCPPSGRKSGLFFGDEFQAYPRAVSIAVFLPNRVVDELIEGPTHTYHAYYDIANALLNDICFKLSKEIEKLGYTAFPIPASQRSGKHRERGIFSHRLAAAGAGLGWIGKNCSLINREVGPRLRLGTVLTDMPLSPDGPVENRCGDCTVCRDQCPPGAILGRPYVAGEPLEKRFIFEKCDDYLTETRQVFGKRICGRCIAVCPWGRKKGNHGIER